MSNKHWARSSLYPPTYAPPPSTVTSRRRTFVLLGSSSDSDRYEELLGNPAILTPARQRGNIDCGGAQCVVIRYGHFFQLVIDLPDGMSPSVSNSPHPIGYVDEIRFIWA